MNNVAIAIFSLVVVLVVSTPFAYAAKDVSAYSENSEPMVVSYLKLGDLGAHYTYRYQVIERALELTRLEYGGYRYQPYTSQSSSIRYAQLLGEGLQLNLLWASPGTPIAKANVIEIPIDMLKGLLGYRVCLINSEAVPSLYLANDINSVANIKFGQGPWPDRAIYKLNHLNTVDAPTFASLFKMLSAKRFDCIPLGVAEAEEMYESQKAAYPFLAIDSNLLIYYHYPLYFYVSKKMPELAQRLKLGLEKMQANGELNKLFIKFHTVQLAHLELHKRKLICLESPYSDSQEECSLPQIYLQNH